MSLQLILGSSGAGKSRYLYENLIQESLQYPQTRYFAIVPEQFTMQTQKEIVGLHPCHGTMNIDIVSFQRLAYRIFEELSIRQLSVLDDIGKSMILRKVLSAQKRKLEIFKGHSHQAGFVHQLKSMLSELYQYGVGPATVEAMITDSASPLLQAKLRDLVTVYQAFETYIENQYITTEEILDVLCNILPRSQLIRQSTITLDGYTGFTPVQYRVLALLMQYASKIMITITIDPNETIRKENPVHELFYMSKHLVQKLKMLAERSHTTIDADICLYEMPRFQNAPAIGFLEQWLFRYTSQTYQNEQDEIQIYQAINPMREVAYVVNQIHQQLRCQGLRYRDIAVITGDLETYGRELSHQLTKEAIPYFLDDKKSILENPMVEWIRAILEVVQSDFSYESMFRYLKSGMVLSEAEMDTLFQMERYVVAMGIRGYRQWNCEWEREDRKNPALNLLALNQLRGACLMALDPIRAVFRQEEVTVAVVTKALIECLEVCAIKDKLQKWEQSFHESGDYAREKEYSQIYDLVIDLLKRLENLLGGETVSRKEYKEILDAGFGELKVGIIPATQDQVLIGDITRTRLDGIQVLFFLGVNDGIVPSKKNSSTLLTDLEREFLRAHQVELAPTAKEDGFIQRFYLYLLLTKPRRTLFLSYVAVSGSGKSMRPSPILYAVKKLFPHLPIRNEMTDPTKIRSAYEGKRRLLDGLRDYSNFRKSEELVELYRWFASTEQYQDKLSQWVEAAFYTEQGRGLGKAAARALYGEVLTGSVTRLEQYAACAYAHFLRYGLSLEEKQEYQLEAADIGNLFHESLYQYFETLEKRNQQWLDLSQEEQKELVNSCVEKVTSEYGNTIMQSSARMSFLSKKIERMTSRTIWALTEQLKKGDFKPVGFEIGFSSQDHLEAMRISLPESAALHLKGRIDRLDLCDSGEQLYVKIIDYKTGSKKFDLTELYYGLQLQLIVYLDAVMELQKRKYPHQKIVPAGVFYYQIKDPLIDRTDAKTQPEIDQQILSQLKMSGLVNSDLDVIAHLDREIEQKSDVIPVALKNGLIQEQYSSVASEQRFQLLQQYVHRKLGCYGEEILAGAIDLHPYKQGVKTACDYCPYHPVCGFDHKESKHSYHKLKALKAQEVWEALEDES